jgi:protein involved in polysaccharide export with SLBB domain
MSVDFKNVKIGDTVRVRIWGGGTRTGVVSEVDEDIKNGRPGISYDAADDGYWCYADQIIERISA